jgi:hypothetical protein
MSRKAKPKAVTFHPLKVQYNSRRLTFSSMVVGEIQIRMKFMVQRIPRIAEKLCRESASM